MMYFIMALVISAIEVAGAPAGLPVMMGDICEKPPFEEGEMARVVVKIGFVKVGEGTAVLQKSEAPPFENLMAVEQGGREEMWYLEGRGFLTGPVALFYKVNDSVKIWMHPMTFLPHQRELLIDETNERATRRVVYDHDAGVAGFWRDRTFYRRNKKREKVTIRENELLSGSFDPFSLFFRLRCVEVAVGDEFEIPLHENGKNYTVKIIAEKVETIDTPLGRKEALRAKIEVYFKGELENKRPYRAWVSNDERRIPLKFVADLKFANLKGVLVGYRPNSEASIEGKLEPEFIQVD